MATGPHLETGEARETLILGTPIRQAAGGLQFGSPWRTGPSTPLSAQLWRSIEPEQTPDHPIGNGYPSSGQPRMHITVPDRLPPDRTVRFDHNGTTYSVVIPQDYSPGSRVEVELTGNSNPPPMNLAAHHGLESPAIESDTLSVQRIRRDVHRFREDLRSYNGVKAHLRQQLELLEEESQLIDACLTSKAEIKRLSDELQENAEQVRLKKERALASSPTKSTPSSRPEADRPAGDQRTISALGSASSQRAPEDSRSAIDSSIEEAAKMLTEEQNTSEARAESEAESPQQVDVPVSPPANLSESTKSVEKVEGIVLRDDINPPKITEQQRASPANAQRISSPKLGSMAAAPAALPPGTTRTTPRVVTRDLLSNVPIRPPLTMPAPVPGAASMMPPAMQRAPLGMPRPLGTGGGASASFPQKTSTTTAIRRESKQPWESQQQERRQPGVAMPPPRTSTVPVINNMTGTAKMRQSSKDAAAPLQPLMQVKSPRMTTRDCLGPVAPQPGPSQGVHPARSTLQICRPSGSVAVRSTGSATEGNRVRTTSPGFRRDQSYRTTLPASLPNSASSASTSPRGSVLNTKAGLGPHRAVQWNVEGKTSSRVR
jgi:hypothetical protein